MRKEILFIMILSKYIIAYWNNGTEVVIPLNLKKSSLDETINRLVIEANDAYKNGKKLFKLKNSDFPLLNSKQIAERDFGVYPIKDKVRNLERYGKILSKHSKPKTQKINLKEEAQQLDDIEIFCIFDTKKNEFLKADDKIGIMFSSFNETVEFINGMVDSIDKAGEKTLIDKMKNWKVYVMKRESIIEVIPKT